mmetsp:Transcript_23591/g.50328  ORF Transcript_23591/g.50328 Transcript_23591/m.50328 type:complete len:218 (+) Transcript_23591:771-1424(+)
MSTRLLFASTKFSMSSFDSVVPPPLPISNEPSWHDTLESGSAETSREPGPIRKEMPPAKVTPPPSSSSPPATCLLGGEDCKADLAPAAKAVAENAHGDVDERSRQASLGGVPVSAGKGARAAAAASSCSERAAEAAAIAEAEIGELAVVVCLPPPEPSKGGCNGTSMKLEAVCDDSPLLLSLTPTAPKLGMMCCSTGKAAGFDKGDTSAGLAEIGSG